MPDSYGSQNSGWRPSANNPTIVAKRKNGTLTGWKSTSKANEKKKKKTPQTGRFSHAGHFSEGPMRASGYGHTGGTSNNSHQAAASRRTNGANKVTGGAYQSTSGGQRGSSKGNASSGTSGPKKSHGPGLGYRARNAKQGSYVSYEAGENPNSGNISRTGKTSENVSKRGGSSIYVVKGGDSWGAIAKRNNTTVQALQKANNWQMKNRKGVIYRNSKIYIPGGSKRNG